MKYKLVACLNLFFGVLTSYISAYRVLVTFPRFVTLYNDFDASYDFTYTYLIVGVIFILGAINIFLGLKLFTKQKEKYFLPAVLFLATLTVLAKIITPFINLSFIIPLHFLAPSL